MADDLQGARDNFGQYYLAINPGYEWVEYQQEIIVPALESVERGDTKRLALWMPPGLGKSDLVTIAFTTWWLGRNPRETAITLSYSTELARDFGLKIKKIMQSPMYAALFPNSVLSKDAHAQNRFRTKAGGNYYAVGFGAVLAGRRAKYIAIDDPIKNWEEAKSPRVQENLFRDYKSIVKTRLVPGGVMVMPTTRWAINDVAERIVEDEPEEWEVLRLPAENPDGSFLWEEHYGKQHFLSAKKDKRTWNALYMQKPGADDGDRWFDPNWLVYYSEPIKPGKFATYMICDPALSKSRRSDRTSIPVFAAGDENKAILVDWVWDRLDPDERTREIIRLVRKWQPRRFIYEEFGLNADTFHLAREMKAADLQCYPIPVGRKGPRHMLPTEARIRELIADFSEGKIVLPEKMERKLSDGTTVDLIEQFRDEEYYDYAGDGTVKHDDGLDTFSRLHEPELDFRFIDLRPSDDDSEKSYYSGRWPGSWESLL